MRPADWLTNGGRLLPLGRNTRFLSARQSIDPSTLSTNSSSRNVTSSPRHYVATILAALGLVFSAVRIVVADSWQQTPAGCLDQKTRRTTSSG